jgi:hypothetical protein
MDINDLFNGIAEAFRRYQQEIVEQEGTFYDSAPAGLEPEEQVEKTEKKVDNREENKTTFPETGVND